MRDVISSQSTSGVNVKALIIGVLLLALSLLPPSSRAQAAAASKGELQDLANSLSGRWKLKIDFEPSPGSHNGMEGSGEEIWQLTPGGLMLIDEESFDARPMKMQIVGFFWTDGVSREKRALDCNNQNQHTCDLKDARDGIAVRWNGKELIVEEPESFNGKQMIRGSCGRISRRTLS